MTPAGIVSAVADITGRVVGEYELRTPRRPGPDAVAHVLEALDGAAASAGVPRSGLSHVVIGTPGAFDPSTRRLRYARHLPGWHDAQLLERLADALGIRFDVGNDVNLAAIAELRSGRARGVGDFLLLWADEGLGAAIVIDGRIHGGATGGAGEVGFLPLPGTPLVRDVRRGNAGGFQELAGGRQVLALARSLGIRATTPTAAVARALDTPGAGDELLETLAERFALGLAAMVAVVDPALVVLAGGVLTAGGDRLLGLIADELGSLAAAQPRLELSSVHDRPVLAGALQTALDSTRDEVFDTVQSPTTASSTARHGTESTMTIPTTRTRRLAAIAAALTLPLAVAACTGDGGGGKSDNPDAETTITFWHGWSADSEVEAIQATVDAFEKENPNIHVNVVGNITDDKINQALRAGGPKAPDVVSSFTTDNVGQFCTSGAFVDLNPFLEESGIDPAATFPPAQLEYTQYEGNQCALPLLGDAYGLYYNKDAFAAAGIKEPPKTMSEFDADALKLTKATGDGYSQLGFMPNYHGYESTITHFAAQWSPEYFDADGKSNVANDPAFKDTYRVAAGASSTSWAATTSSRSTAPRSATSSVRRTRS